MMYPASAKVLLASVLLVLGSVCRAADSSPHFERDVQPLLQAQCSRCHGEKTRKADLNLSSWAALSRGSESGPVIVPGKAEESLLFKMVHEGHMPPTGKLPAEHLDLLRRWLDAGAPADSVVSTEPAVTQHDIEPLMKLRCTVCHGLRKQEAGLDLRTKASMLRGGKSGPAIVLGKPEESLLLKKVHAGVMPPNKRLLEVSVKPMGTDEIDRLTRWIALGAPEVEIAPDVATTEPDPLVTDKDRAFWSFQPPKVVKVPEIQAEPYIIRNPVDVFIVEKLIAKGLAQAPEADKLTLLRRVTFDLTGLPPTPEEARAFLNDASSDSYEKLIDRLLASPRYGERWGRLWLDLAGYADSEGKRSADPLRPHAWRYRDYVIRAFNDDKPYDRFLLEQLAGDELADYANAPEITQELMDNLVATGFLRLAPDGTGSNVVNFVPERMEVVADEIQVLGSSVLGLTLHCARCHSHKYDPIPQRDYFRLADVFKGAYDEHDWLKPAVVPGQGRGSDMPNRYLPYVTKEAEQHWEAYKAKMKEEIDRLKQDQRREAQREAQALQAMIASPPLVRALWDRGEPSPTYIYRRGDYLQPTKLVGPGVLSVLTDGKTPFEVTPPYPGAKSTGRRLAFAQWLTQPDHPLTARVLVNRVWKHHFGAGIVKSLDNFGTTGTPPTHPELLDWLAREFVGSNPRLASEPAANFPPWSIKSLHRLLMMSHTYRQASTITPLHDKLDPDNRWLSRMTMRRLDAEEIYDSLLMVAGKLDETPFGPPDPVLVREDGLVTPLGSDKGWRRSVYVRQRRSQMPTLLETFDLPQMNPNCVQRIDSTVATQALYLKNDTQVRQLASACADRIHQAAGSDPAKQIEAVYWTALGRPPATEERQLGLDTLRRLRMAWNKEKAADPDEAAFRALATYCHVIINSAAFVYVD
ncbi:MAG: PSD1 and planctomycete cytochrome C domain-containing protein [Gemmataceae bacterium]